MKRIHWYGKAEAPRDDNGDFPTWKMDQWNIVCNVYFMRGHVEQGSYWTRCCRSDEIGLEENGVHRKV